MWHVFKRFGGEVAGVDYLVLQARDTSCLDGK